MTGLVAYSLHSTCRSLALFEKDAHRASVMHRQRIKQFAALEGDALSYQHFEGLVKSIALEQANAARQIWAIKDGNGWPQPKVFAATREATERATTFLNYFRTDGKLPDKLDKEWEEHVVTACVTWARLKLRHKVRQLQRAI
jgi:KIF-1 binding protein C terminal